MKTAIERMQADGIIITPALRYHIEQFERELAEMKGQHESLTRALKMSRDQFLQDRDRWRKLAEQLANCVERCRDGMRVGFKSVDTEIFTTSLSRFNAMKEEQTK